MNYGLPYKGSKNKLATRIVDLLPPRKHFYDLFCGGCAVTHAAMMTRKWEDFTINDLNWQCPTLFIDALNGKYKDDTRWISREDFFRLKDSDPYVAFVWSFGNNLKTYLYSKEIEPLKRAIHYALYFDDYKPLKELGHDLTYLSDLKTREQKYSAIRKYFKDKGNTKGNNITPSLLANWGGGVFRGYSTAKPISELEQSATLRDAELGSSKPNQRTCSKKKRDSTSELEYRERANRISSLQTTTQGTNTPLPATLWGGVKLPHLQTITQTYTLSLTA